MKKKLLWILTLGSLLLSLASCGGSDEAANDPGGAGSEAGERKLCGSILAVGSTAMQPLVDQAGQTFMTQDPYQELTVQVQGGGSGTGLTQVSEGQADIGNSDVFGEEKLEAAQAAELVDHQVAVVAITAVVNPAVTIDDLSKEQMVDIFTGAVKNWKELGGEDQEIVIVNRPASSGTRATFETFALGQSKLPDLQGSIQEDSSGTVKKLVAETPGAIGYLALSYLGDDSIKPVKYDGVQATVENVQNGSYPVWAYQHMYTKGEPSEAVQAFLDYMVSPEVQEGGVVELGYIPVSGMQVTRDAAGNVSKN